MFSIFHNMFVLFRIQFCSIPTFLPASASLGELLHVPPIPESAYHSSQHIAAVSHVGVSGTMGFGLPAAIGIQVNSFARISVVSTSKGSIDHVDNCECCHSLIHEHLQSNCVLIVLSHTFDRDSSLYSSLEGGQPRRCGSANRRRWLLQHVSTMPSEFVQAIREISFDCLVGHLTTWEL